MKNDNTVVDLQARAHSHIAAGSQHLGDLVSWNVNDVDVRRDDLRAAFAVGGPDFAALVPVIDAAAALGRAKARVTPKSKDIFVRFFPKPNKDTPAAVGVYREIPRDGESGSDVVCGARARVNVDRVYALSPENGTADEECLAHAESLATYANHLLDYCATTDLGACVVQTLKGKLAGVPLRDAGGVYFLPAARANTWRAIAQELAKLMGATEREISPGVKVWEGGNFRPVTLEVPDSPQAAQSIATGAKDSLESELGQLRADLLAAVEAGGFAKRSTIVHRVDECEKLMDRARLYRGILDDFSKEIGEAARQMQASFERELTAYDSGKRGAKSSVLDLAGDE